jgi:thioesterase domain-containing protein
LRDAVESSDARWGEVASAGLTRLEVPGDHFTMLKPPAAAELAEALRRWFASV